MKKIPHFAIATAAAFALAAAPALAKTLVWNTSVTTSSSSPAMLSAAANWLENGNTATTGPEPGDRLEIGGSAKVYFGAETFNIGSAGLTIYHTSKIYIKTVFTGAGVLTFDGSSNVERVFDATTSSSHTGGTVIKSGYSKFDQKNVNPLGTGRVEIHQASSTRPRLQVTAGARLTLDNDFVLYGKESIEEWTPFDTEMPFLLRSISADHDFTINCSDRAFYVPNGISAPGKTVTFNVQCTSTSSFTTTDISGAIDANVVVKAYTDGAAKGSIVRFFGESTVASNTLTVASGTNILMAAAVWGGTNITVGATATLSLKGSGNLSPSAHLAVAEGGTIEVSNNVTVQVAALTVGDKAMPAGIYTASTLPGTVSGSGTLRVLGGNPFVWTGADPDNPTQWSVAANWQGNEVPGDGAVVYFPSAATIENATDVIIGANGLSLVLGGDVILKHGFAGSGALRISGGTFSLRANVVFSHTGGTTLSGNIRFDMGTPQLTKDAFGTGVLTIDGMSGGSPFIRFVNWAQAITNDIVILGAATNRTYTHQSRTVRGLVVDFNAGYISGSVTGDDDGMFGTGYGSLHVRGNVTVPEGKTIRLQNAYVSEGTPRYLEVTKTLTGNLSVEGVGLVRLTTSATCTGDVTVRDTATLQLTADANLAETAVVSVETGGKIDIASDVKVQVAELYVGGVQQPHGVYNATNLPAVITGSGKLQAGPTTATVISFR